MSGAAEPDDGRGRPWTLVFDGNCDVCLRLARLVGEWDTRRMIALVPSEDPGLAAIELTGPGGETWVGSAAVERLLHLLPRGWLGRWIFRLPFGAEAADRGYRWFARHRHRFGCRMHCRATAAAPPARRWGTSPGSPHGS
jgi:predicted DCC family thiol-disulfide oxidoreductase YuxK